MKKRLRYFGIIIGLTCFVFGALSISIQAPTKTGLLIVKMNTSNMLNEFEQINIDIAQVELRYGNKVGAKSWMVLVPKVGVTDLTNYQSVPIVLSDGLEIEAGELAQIKIHFGNNNSAVIEGRSYAIKLADEPEVIIDLSKDIEDSDQIEVMLNIDVAKSITTNSQQNFSFNPSIRMSSILPFK